MPMTIRRKSRSSTRTAPPQPTASAAPAARSIPACPARSPSRRPRPTIRAVSPDRSARSGWWARMTGGSAATMATAWTSSPSRPATRPARRRASRCACPFRSATALVTVEREGVLSSFVTTLSGKDPVVEVKLDGSYAPNAYVSVMAVRGGSAAGGSGSPIWRGAGTSPGSRTKAPRDRPGRSRQAQLPHRHRQGAGWLGRPQAHRRGQGRPRALCRARHRPASSSPCTIPPASPPTRPMSPSPPSTRRCCNSSPMKAGTCSAR